MPQLRPCDARSLQFSTEERRTLHWHMVIKSMGTWERMLCANVRSLFAAQRAAVLQAIEDVVG